MCGILLSLQSITAKTPAHTASFDSFLSVIAPRGPDASDSFTTSISLPSGDVLQLKIASSVLALRGTGVTKQPIVGSRGVLAWNGQVFSGIEIGINQNDTAILFDKLEQAADVTSTLSGIEGPYAFVYYDKLERKLYFQVDPLSRRSLLIGQAEDAKDNYTCFMLSSARPGGGPPMRSLNGGEGGVICLDRIVFRPEGLDLSQALSWNTRKDGIWDRVAPINAALPSSPPEPIEAEVDRFIDKLTRAVRRRVENVPLRQPDTPRICILFSGGVDCTLLAFLVHKLEVDAAGADPRCLPAGEPVELVNVAFQRPPRSSAEESDYRVPDRLSGLQAREELKQTCPTREWRFVEVDVEYDECLSHRQTVLDLMYPANTEMDMSLAFPLYFASRGIRSGSYAIQSKVFISGLGADEQLAGYARHRHAFQQGGLSALIAEIQLDLDRLPSRNLSRDDRMLSSHGRDGRFPYLDLDFVAYLSSLPIWLKCNLATEGGDKRLLRLAAARCGLHATSARVKRAMQFGTRSSKVGSAGRGPGMGQMHVQ